MILSLVPLLALFGCLSVYICYRSDLTFHACACIPIHLCSKSCIVHLRTVQTPRVERREVSIMAPSKNALYHDSPLFSLLLSNKRPLGHSRSLSTCWPLGIGLHPIHVGVQWALSQNLRASVSPGVCAATATSEIIQYLKVWLVGDGNSNFFAQMVQKLHAGNALFFHLTVTSNK